MEGKRERAMEGKRERAKERWSDGGKERWSDGAMGVKGELGRASDENCDKDQENYCDGELFHD
jgi:hypothetical protein